ncbi:MAG: nuclease A inhibitor family protein [Phormidesmis sp.]
MTSTSELKAQLEAACKDLWWRSEADYPLTVVWQSAADVSAASDGSSLNSELVRQLMSCDDDAEVEEGNVEGFFERSLTPHAWHTDEDKARISRLQHLKTLLTTALVNPQVYRCGEAEVSMSVLGRTSEGHVAGVQTTVVET